MSDRLGWQIQKHAEAFLPLVEQLLPVNDHQRVHFALRNQPCRNGGLPECRRSAQDAFVLAGDLRNGFFLERPKLSLELNFNGRPSEPFIANFRPNLVRFQKSQCLR
jgi:hypothetical protein